MPNMTEAMFGCLMEGLLESVKTCSKYRVCGGQGHQVDFA